MKIWNEIGEDIFNYYKWFSREEVNKNGYSPNLSVFSINGVHCTDKNSRTSFFIEAAKTINSIFRNMESLHDYTFYLLANIEIYRPSSLISKHKKVWKTIKSSWLIEDFNLGPEIEVGLDDKIIYTSIASFCNSELAKSLEIVSSNPKMFTIIASTHPDVMDLESIKSIFETSFSRKSSEIDYTNLILKRCLANDIVFRFGDSSEEIEVALIFKSELVDVFKSSL